MNPTIHKINGVMVLVKGKHIGNELNSVKDRQVVLLRSGSTVPATRSRLKKVMRSRGWKQRTWRPPVKV